MTTATTSNNLTANDADSCANVRQKILLDLFQKLPTDYLLCAARLACREWKQYIESADVQRALWQPRAAYFQQHGLFVASKCGQQQVRYITHQEAEKKHNTTFSQLDRCLHYYTSVCLWLTQRRICNSWMAHYYTSTGDMHKYWCMKHERSQRMGDAFNEVDTELALQTVATSRSAALDAALESYTEIPFTAPV